MWIWSVEGATKTTAYEKNVWKLWSDVNKWPIWDQELQWSKLNGPFKIGSKGELKPKGWPVTKFALTEVTENQSFSNIGYMPFTTHKFEHSLTKLKNGKLMITHKATVHGLLAPLLSFVMKRNLAKRIAKRCCRGS